MCYAKSSMDDHKPTGPTKPKRATKTVVLDASLHRELKVLAVQKEQDLSLLLNEAVGAYLENNGTSSVRHKRGSDKV